MGFGFRGSSGSEVGAFEAMMLNPKLFHRRLQHDP